MNALKFAWIDDEPTELQHLSAMMQTVFADRGIPDSEIHGFSGRGDFFAVWHPGRFDIIVLDIFLGESDGVSIARQIRETDPTVALVFCSASNEFAAESYEVNARYYLQKPVTAKKLSLMLQRIDMEELEKLRSIQLPDGYRLLLRRLIYTNYFNHSVTFYIQGGDPHSLYITQTEVEQLLSDPCFYPANKGSIVNLYMVRKVTEDSFLMDDGTAVSIARRRYKEAREAYSRFHFHKLSEEADQ